MAIDLAPLGQAAAFGPTGIVGPVLTAAGMVATADLAPGSAIFPTSQFPQTERWPYPGSGQLHPLDYITILGVQLPLAKMPQGGVGLDVSHRKSPGADHSTLVSHGMKTSPVKIELLLFRDQSLGYKDGQRVGKDWWYEWEKIKDKLIAKKLEKRGALSVSYPTLAAVGCDSLIFTHIGLPQPKGIGMFVVDLEAYDPRTVKDGGGSKKVVKQLEKVGSRAAPSPQRQADAAATARVKAGSSADALSSWTQAVAPPSASRRGR